MTCANRVEVEDGHVNSKVKTTSSETRAAGADRKWRALLSKWPTAVEAKQYLGVSICGLAVWACAYLVLGEPACPGGWLLGMASLAVSGYVAGHTLERLTTIPALVGMTLAGVLFRNLAIVQFHTHAHANTLDYHLRRLYPVIILTKGPLGWDWNYIKANYVIVFALATLPWIVEWLSLTTLAYYIMDLPWKWGIHLGSIIASVSPAVVVPTVVGFRERGFGVKKDISKLVGCAGGLDTAFTEGMFGVINAAIFVEASYSYRFIKGFFAVLVGIGLGVCWGVLVDYVPDHRDPLAATAKSLIIIWGGLCVMYGAGFLGWGGTAGVAVMVCSATAATRWARRGWPLNTHPVAEVFRVLWTLLEPMLFSFSGYFLEIDKIELSKCLQIMGCVSAALAMRMLAAFLVSMAGGFSASESIFVSITWIPKAIVEAVLVRAAFDSLQTNASAEERSYARMHVNVIVIAIVITSTLGSLLTTVLGPVLLKRDLKIFPTGILAEPGRGDSAPTA